MRVALISETFLPSVNGVTTTLCRLLEHLERRGGKAILFAPLGAPSMYAGARVVPLGSLPLPFYPEVQLTPPQWGITAQLRRFKPDLVHAVGPLVLGSVVPVVANTLRVPLVSSYHTDFGAYSQHYGIGFLKHGVDRYLRWIHNRCMLTLCPSSATLRDLQRLGFRRLRVWGRGVDTARFHPDHRSAAWREGIGARPEDRVLLYVGRLAPEKRVDLLADALLGLPNVRLVIVGDGPARSDLERRMADLPVHFTGYLRGDDLATAYASANAFVFPSPTETFGQVVQEAMSSGLPVVGARSGGTLDLVRPGVNGLLFDPGSAADLHAQLDRLLADAPTLATMGRRGRALAETRSWPVLLDELLGYYDRARRSYPRPRTAMPQHVRL
jgi:phosphatidylinositol alpha 1,6-mannosyltransferase